MAIDLYQMAASPPCRAVVMTAQHLGIQLNLKKVNLFQGEQLKPDFLKLNPQHTIPTINDNGFCLWESRAIMKYLVNKYAPDSSLYPKDPLHRAAVDRMLYFDIGTLHKAHLDVFRPMLFKGEVVGADKYKVYHEALQVLEDTLALTTYAAGNHVTLADYSILPTLTMAQFINVTFEEYPKIRGWMSKLKEEIPSYKQINEDPLNQLKEYIESKRNK